MKKIIVASLLLLFPLISMNARVNWGVKGGLNVANSFSANNVFSSDGYTGFFIGPKMDWDLGKNFSLNGSFIYSQSGMKFNNTNEKVDLNSLLIPINASVRLLGTDKFGLFVEFGPQYNFNLGQKRRELKDKELNFNNSSFSLNAGLTLHLFNHLQIGANYNCPFGKTSEFVISDTANSEAYKIHTLQISATVMF